MACYTYIYMLCIQQYYITMLYFVKKNCQYQNLGLLFILYLFLLTFIFWQCSPAEFVTVTRALSRLSLTVKTLRESVDIKSVLLKDIFIQMPSLLEGIDSFLASINEKAVRWVYSYIIKHLMHIYVYLIHIHVYVNYGHEQKGEVKGDALKKPPQSKSQVKLCFLL